MQAKQSKPSNASQAKQRKPSKTLLLDQCPSTEAAHVRRRQRPDIAAAIATAAATNLATTLATTTATTKRQWLQQGAMAEAKRAAMAVVRATALVMIGATAGAMVTAMAAVLWCQRRHLRRRQRGNKVYEDNNNNMTPTQKPTQQPRREQTRRGLVQYSNFFCSRVNGGAYPTAKPGFSGVQKSDIKDHR
jgi:hypothetical protein